jgi:uncharacterized NAD(P)/FAD-binding protein YdhS
VDVLIVRQTNNPPLVMKSLLVNDLRSVFRGTNFDGAGFNAVMEQLNDTGKWLSQDAGKVQKVLFLIWHPQTVKGTELHMYSLTPSWLGLAVLRADTVFSLLLGKISYLC